MARIGLVFSFFILANFAFCQKILPTKINEGNEKEVLLRLNKVGNEYQLNKLKCNLILPQTKGWNMCEYLKMVMAICEKETEKEFDDYEKTKNKIHLVNINFLTNSIIAIYGDYSRFCNNKGNNNQWN
jgi:hypothetical protein